MLRGARENQTCPKSGNWGSKSLPGSPSPNFAAITIFVAQANDSDISLLNNHFKLCETKMFVLTCRCEGGIETGPLELSFPSNGSDIPPPTFLRGR